MMKTKRKVKLLKKFDPNYPSGYCKDCPAGEMKGKGCIKFQDRGCWLLRRQ